MPAGVPLGWPSEVREQGLKQVTGSFFSRVALFIIIIIINLHPSQLAFSAITISSVDSSD